MKVALLYNGIKRDMLINSALDKIAELDSSETIDYVREALMADGNEVILIEADGDAYGKLKEERRDIDIVFNIAEGLRGESRESYIPAICDMLEIPYTGSGVLTLGLCLNKVRTKEILRYYGIPTPDFWLFRSKNEKLDLELELKFPLIVKLLHEGSQMGLSSDSIVCSEEDLRDRVAYLMHEYGEPVIVEEFLDGREFTVGILGNEKPIILPIVEALFEEGQKMRLFTPDKPLLPFIPKGVAINLKERSVCPADVDEDLRSEIEEIALNAYRALDCRDWCRIDLRMTRDGDIPNVLELNPIAGIDPSYLLPRAAKAAGISYKRLINMILEFGAKRYGLK
nr:putative D-alanine--D-alanine ligase [uncultured archaeon]CBH37244.1 putative D-alanine--D-alanine ligase [uncultured archaeon]